MQDDLLNTEADLQTLTSKGEDVLMVVTLLLVTLIVLSVAGAVYYRVYHNYRPHHNMINRESESCEPIIQIIASPSHNVMANIR